MIDLVSQPGETPEQTAQKYLVKTYGNRALLGMDRILAHDCSSIRELAELLFILMYGPLKGLKHIIFSEDSVIDEWLKKQKLQKKT